MSILVSVERVVIPLGPFELIKPIGRGGSCEVWRGVHRDQGHPVAIKVVFGRKARTPRFISAFREEVRAVAGLSHPSIVMVFDYGLIPPETASQSGGKLQEGSPFLVMELGEETLHAFTDRLSWPQIYKILLSLLDGLAHAHARGVIHRDIKPANILVCDNHKQVKLSDFGLAHAMERNEAPRHAREMVGTPSYMAPEQFELRWRDYGPWTDLYAFGCTTYAMLSGFPPFGRTEQLEDMMAAHLYKPVPSLPPRLPVPKGFMGWLRKLLAKDPRCRFQRPADAALSLVQIAGDFVPERDAEWGDDRSSPFAMRPTQSEGELLGDAPTLHTLHSVVGGTPTPSVLPAVTGQIQESFLQHTDGLLAPEASLEQASLNERQVAEETLHHPPEPHVSFPPPSLDSLQTERTMESMVHLSAGEARVTPTSLSESTRSLKTEEVGPLATQEPTPYEMGSGLHVEMPPLPDTWRRDDSMERSRALNNVGLGLYGLRTVSLVGRERERDLLWSELSQVIERREVRLVCLSGSAGAGKSRLARWLCERAHEVGAAHTMRALHSPIPGFADGLGAMLSRHMRCSGLGRADVLQRVTTFLDDNSSVGLEEGYALTELIAPIERTGEADSVPHIRFGDPSERYEAVRLFIQRLCEQRAMIVWLDDVQWSFDALSFAQFMLRSQRWRPLPLLLVLTVREEALAERRGEGELLQELLQEPRAHQLDIGPLDEQENSALVRELLGLQGELALQVEQRAAGNPLFAVQLVGDWVQRGLLQQSSAGFRLAPGVQIEIPDSLHQVWNDRIQQILASRTQTEAIALELAATLGIEVERDEWIKVCEQASVPVPDALLELLFGQRLAFPLDGNADGNWVFAHSMIRESLERRAREKGRWSTHHKLCAAMLAHKEGPGMAERLGIHLLLAGDDRGALRPLLKGIWEHVDAGDFRRAELRFAEWKSILERLSLSSGDELWGEAWLLRCRIARGVGSYEQGGKLAEMVVRDARRHEWERILIHALLEQANCGWRLGVNEDDVWMQLEEAQALASARSEPELKAECHRYMGNFLCLRGKLAEASRNLVIAHEIFASVDDTIGIARCFFGLSNVERQAGRFTEAKKQILLALKAYESSGSRRGIVDCLNSLGDLARFEGDLVQSETYYRESLVRYDALGGGGSSICKLNITLVLLQREQYDEAKSLVEETLVSLSQTGQRDLEGIAHLCMLPSVVAHTHWDEWDLHFEAARLRLEETGVCDVDSAKILETAGEMAANAGEVTRAKAAFLLSHEQWTLLGREDEAQRVVAHISTLFPSTP